MIPLSLQEIARMSEGELASGGGGGVCAGVSTDSRNVAAGDLFVAIRGERFDGHAFVGDALSGGAAGALIDRRFAENLPGDRDRLIVVEDTAAALGKLAAAYRHERLPASCRVVAITGSNGKTTTKRMLHHILRDTRRGVASPRSFNNHIGVPLTLLSAGADDAYVIVEVGTNAPGEIAHLSRLSEPEVAVVTSVSEAHLAGLGSVRGVAREKLSLLDGLRGGGHALICNEREETRAELARRSDPRVVTFGRCGDAALMATNLASDGTAVTFDLRGEFSLDAVRVPICGVHHALNAAAAMWAASRMGLPPEVARERLSSFESEVGRASRREAGGVTMIDDTYNANPESMRGAVRSLMDVPAARRLFVMGDMGELGAGSVRLHDECFRFAAESGVDVVVASGPQCAKAASALQHSAVATTAELWIAGEPGALAQKLEVFLSAGDAVWFKASRAQAMERVVKALEDLLHTRDARGAAAPPSSGRSASPQPANP